MDHLTPTQARLYDDVVTLASADGSDCRDVLIALPAAAADKAAVADALGGPNAGAQLLADLANTTDGPDAPTPDQIDATLAELADPNASPAEAAWWDHYAENHADVDDHHLWLSGMGDAQLAEHLAEDPDDAAAVERVRAERAAWWRRQNDTDEPAF
jgi:hypothetical protein